MSRFLHLDRNAWRRLRTEPGYLPEGLDTSLAIVRFAAGDVRERQRKTKSRLRGSAPDMVAALPTEGAESHWRVASAIQLDAALFPERGEPAPSRLTLAYLDPRQIKRSDIASYFLNEVGAEELPRARLTGIVDYIQRRYELTAGNWMDQGHAVEMLYVDSFVTRDATFVRALRDANELGSLRAGVVLIDNSASVVDQLRSRISVY